MAERRQASSRSPWGIAVVLVAAISMLLPAPVAAQTTLTLDPAEGPHGRMVDAIGAGFSPDSSILLLWDGQLIKSVKSGSAASFKVAFRVPGQATWGPHTVTMCVAGSQPDGCGDERANATFRITPGATPTPSPSPTPLESEGAGIVASPPPDPLPALIGALVIGAAAAILILVRRRRIAAAERRAAEPGAWRRRRAT
jgi:hypothetical protein